MKLFMKLLTVFLFAGVMFFTMNSTVAEASEKVYREYQFKGELNKFPIKLTNGLTINKKVTQEYIDYMNVYVPTIEKNGKIIWEGTTFDPEANTRIGFTVTKNKDTFFYIVDGYRSYESLKVIGVNESGKVFLQKEFKGNGLRMAAKFLNANTIDISYERENEQADSSADMFTGLFYSKIYKLYAKGTMEQVSYFDAEFASLAKKGQLKGALGQLKGTFKSLKSDPQFHEGTVDISETWQWYNMPYASYAFLHGSNSQKISDKQTIRAIYKKSSLIGTRKTFEPELKKLFGAPVYKQSNHLFVYKAGNNYVGVRYDTMYGISSATVAVIDAEYYRLVKMFGL